MTKKSSTTVGVGGGGGDRDKLQAPKGKLPKLAMEQITPPVIVIRNDHPKLPVEPTVVVPPQIKLASNMPSIGNPMAAIPSGPPSNGTGSGGGIGSGPVVASAQGLVRASVLVTAEVLVAEYFALVEAYRLRVL